MKSEYFWRCMQNISFGENIFLHSITYCGFKKFSIYNCISCCFCLFIQIGYCKFTPNKNQKMTRDSIGYSDKYTDNVYEYRHVILPSDIAELVPRNHLMTETEWRNLGVQQSPLWVHYMVHNPEPHILLFRRKLTEEEKERLATNAE